MYEAKFNHKFNLKDIKKGIKLSYGEIRKRVVDVKSHKNYLQVNIKGYVVVEKGIRVNTERTIVYFQDGRIRGERKTDIRMGIKLLQEIGIILPDPTPSIYRVKI